jgi:hypothetical protein
MMNTQFKIQRFLAAELTCLFLCIVTTSAPAQQTNPNNLPLCPRPDFSKNTDNERFAKWTNCWGRYKFELDKNRKGDVLEGEWRNAWLHGQGKYIHAQGHGYSGEWKDGKIHGKGTQTFGNGDMYVGENKDGKMHGQGIYTYADGRRQEGIWENNFFIRETTVNLPIDNYKPIRTTQNLSVQDTAVDSFGIEDAKVKCQELGFKTGTERYGKCVLELSR